MQKMLCEFKEIHNSDIMVSISILHSTKSYHLTIRLYVPCTNLFNFNFKMYCKVAYFSKIN